MKLEDPVRWGGLAALLTGALLVASDLLRLYVRSVDPGAFAGMLSVDGWLSLLLAVVVQLGLVGLYAPHARAMGSLGLVGFVLASIGVQLAMGSSFVFAFIRPIVGPGDPAFFEEPVWSVARFGLTFVLGWVLLGTAMLRARVYPRTAAALLVVGALILLLPLPLNDVVFAAAVAWLGRTLLAGRGEESGSSLTTSAAGG